MRVVLLLLLFGIWLSGSGETGLIGPWPGLLIFAAGYVLVAISMRWWATRLAERLRQGQDRIRWFNWAMLVPAAFVPAWLAVGIYVLSWSDLVQSSLGPVAHWPVRLPSVLVGILPGLLAWMSLAWSQYPTDSALREITLLDRIDANLPVFAPPGFWSYFGNKLRTQVLFTIAPVLLILLVGDLLRLGLISLSHTRAGARLGLGDPPGDLAELVISFTGVAMVLLFAPEALRRVLRTRPLPPSALRDRLETIGQQAGLRYRQILLWDTGHNTGNAAVMGLFPRVRYVLLSDLLIETMTDEQIEAVFAHEIGHVRHRHLVWFIAFFIGMNFGAFGAGQLMDWLIQMSPGSEKWSKWGDFGVEAMVVAAIVLAFGYVSRWFERQADVFAARTIESSRGAVEPDSVAPAGENLAADAGFFVSLSEPNLMSAMVMEEIEPYRVGTRGAGVFADALERVAYVNGIPLSAGNWTHGSIATRMRFVRSIARDPALTKNFDRQIRRVYIGLTATLLLCAASAGAAWLLVPAANAGVIKSSDAINASPSAPGNLPAH